MITFQSNNTRQPIVSFIYAVSENNVIGRDNKLPWHLPKDLQFFKEQTWGKPIIMGRKTWDSINRVLPNRTNSIVSNSLETAPEGTLLFASIESCLLTFRNMDEIMIIGGAQLFAETLPIVNRIYRTLVHAEVEGDILMPHINFKKWVNVFTEKHTHDDDHAYDFTFEVWDRT